ncbi:hypothetical protein BSL78_03600 [Apostichopus japonicus]|uniref:Protein transport protein Sec24C n=1 Tax=Stichopus japonicus TaxID=307972 RepID=A0A2G8LGT0_STIJA|nr:hypothetical protein BSL78_03600 [Apostichopus japonicus]
MAGPPPPQQSSAGPVGLPNQMAGMNLNQAPPSMGPPTTLGHPPMQRPPFSQPGTYGGTSTGAQQQMGYGQPRPGMPMQTSQPPGPPTSMLGPTSAMAGPPNSMHGPPGNFQGPPSGQPPVSMHGTQGNFQGPPNSMHGPPNSMHGPPGGPHQQLGQQPMSRYPGPQSNSFSGPPQPGYSGPPTGGVPQGVPAYPGGPPVPPPQSTPPMSPGPMSGPGMRPPYHGGPPGPGMAPGMAPGPSVQPPPKKLNPDQMPSVIQVIQTDRNARGGQQFLTNLWGQVPPLVTTEFQAIDQGISSPRFFRSTVYSIPCNQDMVKQSQIPIGFVVKPFADLPDNEMAPPITDHGPNGPVRCNRCKAYMCPFMTFVEGGRRFQCAFCYGITDVPPEYIQPLDHMGKRVDISERPELALGTYEYLATTDYCKNNKLPQAPAYIFMIDVTYQSMKTGMVHLLCKELKSLLDRLPTEHGMKESAIRVGFVTYDSTLHFYNVNSALAQPQMMVVSDVHDVFMPLLDGFMMAPPITDHGPNGPVRCNRCKAYMCPFMTFVEGGRRFQCAFCYGITDVPPEYIQPLDHMGKRVDISERPELALGTYEYLATTDYCKNNKLPQAPAYIFMIDVTYQSMKTGMVHLLCKELKSLLDRLPTEHGMKESAIRVGFVTYDSTLHFYNVNSALAQPQMMVVSDVHDVFMPLLDGFMVKLSESRAVIDSLLDQIPEMFFDTRETESMLSPVVEAGLAALVTADLAGKLFVFHSSLPIADAPGKLKTRDDRKLLGTEKEKTILSPQSQVYTKLGQECVKAGCSVDLFLFPNSYVDVATIGQVTSLTGGHCYKYKHFQAAVDGERFIHDLTTNIERISGFDAVLRVRTSAGIRPTDFFGNIYMSNTTDVELAAVDGSKAITVEVKHDDKLTEDTGAFTQVAVLYTSVSGQRRLRIINFAFNCCAQLSDLYKNCDTDTIVNFLAKKAARDVLHSNPKAIREGLMSRCAAILACYRKNCASPSTQGQLILPECMKVLPLFINSVIKSDAIAGCTDITTDDRSWLMQTLLGMDVLSTHVYFYPQLIPIHDISPDGDDIPMSIRCSADRFSDKRVYLLENGLMMFLWIGLHVSNEWVQSIFGVNSPAQIDIDSSKLLLLDNPLSVRLRNLIESIRRRRSHYMKLAVVRQRDTLEPWFKQFLVEDKGANASASYVDFLVHMHKEIRNILN